MKTKEELNALKQEVEAMNSRLRDLTDEELAQVAGGSDMEDRVIRGDYGNGEERAYNLRQAAYDYGRVQNEKNRRPR